MRNLVTDVAGISVGHAGDDRLISGVTALVFDRPAVASIDIRGGASGSRESDLLLPERLVEHVDAIILAGGSAFGLDAASGAMAALAKMGRGYAVGAVRVPIVPAAILFDMLNGGDKKWGDDPPYRELGAAAITAASLDFMLGSAGAGLGATTADLKGGLGSASAITAAGRTIGALAAVNAVGRVTMGDSRHFWAAPFEIDSEFGGHGLPGAMPRDAAKPVLKGGIGQSTTLAVVATDATLTKTQCRQLAIMAQDGLARAIYPVHTLHDGDTVFAVATGKGPAPSDPGEMTLLGTLAANTLARAIARGVHAAADDKGSPLLPSYRQKWGG